MSENLERALGAKSKRLACRCSDYEVELFGRAVEHLGTNLSAWMRATVMSAVEEAHDPEQRVAMQARYYLFQGTAKTFGRVGTVLNARAPDGVVSAFVEALGVSDLSLSLALRWALYEAAQLALLQPSKSAHIAAHEALRTHAATVQPDMGHVVETLPEEEA